MSDGTYLEKTYKINIHKRVVKTNEYGAPGFICMDLENFKQARKSLDVLARSLDKEGKEVLADTARATGLILYFGQVSNGIREVKRRK